MSELDSVLRERLDAAAAFDVDTDPRRVREDVARRQRRIRRRRRGTAVAGVLAVAGVAVGVVRVVERDSGSEVAARAADSPEETSVPAEAPTETAPRFLPVPGWEVSEAGLTAANIALGPGSLAGEVPWDTVERLGEGDVVLFAMSIPVGETSAVDASFPPSALPLSVDDAEPGGLEGQPDHIYAERLAAEVNGWNIDLLIFYGSTPSAETHAAAQEQLTRLAVPVHDTPELSPASEDTCQPSNLEAAVFLDDRGGLLAGHIRVRNVGDVACTLEGHARLVEPHDVNGTVPPFTASEIDPAWQQAGEEAPDGWPTVWIAPGSEAQAELQIRNWCGAADDRMYFFIRLPHHVDRIAGEAPSVQIPPLCDDPKAPMALAFGPFEPPLLPE